MAPLIIAICSLAIQDPPLEPKMLKALTEIGIDLNFPPPLQEESAFFQSFLELLNPTPIEPSREITLEKK